MMTGVRAPRDTAPAGENATRGARFPHRAWHKLVAFALILTLAPLAAPPLAARASAPAQAPVFGARTGAPSIIQATGPATYTNPIDAQIPMSTAVNEDCPDPSIIHGQTTGDTDWYAYCTSGPLNNNDRDSSGNLVIHRMKMLSSHDLVHWTYRGDVLGKSSDVPSTRPSWLLSDNTFAPDIRYFNNRYYLYYAGPDSAVDATHPMSNTGPAIFVVTSTTPLGPWTAYSKPVVEPEPPPCCTAPRATIDPAVVTDSATGERYMFYGSYYGGVSARRLLPDGLSTSTSETTVMTGINPLAQITIPNRYEGSYVVQHGGYYYLFVSATNCCNGPLTGYLVFAGRSQNVLGPYVDREGNSLLAGRVGGTPVVAQNGNRWVGPGHNAVFTDADGQDWFLYHAVDRNDPYFTNADGSVAFTKRPLMMDPLDWGPDGWPVVRGGFGPSDTPQPAPAAQPGDTEGYTPVFAQAEQPGTEIPSLSDEFNGTTYGPQWTWVRQPSTSVYSVTNGTFNFQVQKGVDLYVDSNNASVLTEPTPPGDYIVETKVHINLPPEGCCHNYAQAGLVIYGDDDNFIKLATVSIFETRQTEFAKELKPVPAGYPRYGNGVVGPPGGDANGLDTYLRIVKTTGSNGEELYRAYTSQDGVHYVRGGVWTHTLGPTARIGLVSMAGDPNDQTYTANFDYVRVYTIAPMGGPGGAPTPELGSGELLATGLLPLVAALLYRRSRRRRAGHAGGADGTGLEEGSF